MSESLCVALINRRVSCVAPSVSSYHPEPLDLFQMSGSNGNSWTVTNCVSLGIPAWAKGLVASLFSSEVTSAASETRFRGQIERATVV